MTNSPDFQAAVQGQQGPIAQQHAQGLMQEMSKPENLLNNPLHKAELLKSRQDKEKKKK